MSDAVAIVSVASSAAVGLSGIVAGLYGASRARGWQARADRAADLTAVLDVTDVEEAIQGLRWAHETLGRIGPETDAADAQAAQQDAFNDANACAAACGGLLRVRNRIKLRQGSDSKTAAALESTVVAINKLSAGVQDELDGKRYAASSPTPRSFDDDWSEARAAADAFYNAAASDLHSPRI